MNKTLITMFLVLATSAAMAQSASVSVGVGQGTVAVSAADQKEADAFCLRQTGSHVRSITPKAHGDRAVECASAPGRVYSREDIERTGATTTAQALRLLDPSIR